MASAGAEWVTGMRICRVCGVRRGQFPAVLGMVAEDLYRSCRAQGLILTPQNPADPADPALTSLRVGYRHDCNKRFIRSASLECWPAALWYPSSDMDNGAKDIPVFIALMLADSWAWWLLFASFL